jgi:hypothetical protein
MSVCNTQFSCTFVPVLGLAAQGAALTAQHATLTQAGTDSGDVALMDLRGLRIDPLPGASASDG